MSRGLVELFWGVSLDRWVLHRSLISSYGCLLSVGLIHAVLT